VRESELDGGGGGGGGVAGCSCSVFMVGNRSGSTRNAKQKRELRVRDTFI